VSRYVEEHRGRFGVEPICRTLQVAPSSYYAARSREPSEHARHDERLAVEYGWKVSGRLNTIRLATRGDGALPADGSAEQFITEHYWGYAATKDGGCVEYQVRHPQWKVWGAGDVSFDGNMEDLYGKDLNEVLQRPPDSAFLAEGSGGFGASGNEAIDSGHDNFLTSALRFVKEYAIRPK